MVSSTKVPSSAKVHKTKKVGKVDKKLKKTEIDKKLKKADKKVIHEPSPVKPQLTTVEVVPKNKETEQKRNYVMPSKYITENVVKSSLIALDQLVAHHKKNNVLFEDEQPIFAEIHCIKIQNSRGNIKFVLPHSTVASTGEVCLITPDLKKGKKIDHEPTVDHWEELLRKSGVTEVKTVLPVRQLKVEYDQYELKRRLLTQHDFIMVDTRVLSHVSHILGKMFFKKHNMLIPVRIKHEAKLKQDIKVGLCTAMLRVSEGQTSTLLIGHTGMDKDKLQENILSFVNQIQSKYPGGEANIRSISIKLPLSMSLPLYITLRPSDTIKPPKLVHKKPKNFRVLEDELTTVTNGKVRVNPDGTVRLLKSEENKNENMEISGEVSDGDEESANESTDK